MHIDSHAKIYVSMQTQYFKCTVCGNRAEGKPIIVDRWVHRTDALMLENRPNMTTSIPVGWSCNGYNKGDRKLGRYDVRCCK